MSELEQRLTNELGKLAEQYGQDQKRLAGQCASLAGQCASLAGQCASLAGQVTRLEEQVRQLAGQYEQAQKEYAEWANRTTALAEDHQKMGAHVTKLTDAYESANNSHNALVRDLDALFR